VGIGGSLRTLSTCLLLAVFLVCASVSGCGESDAPDSNDFAQGYNASIHRLGAVNRQLAALDVSTKSSRAIARQFDRFGAALASTRAELGGLKPPAPARREFNALLAALDDAVAASHRAARAARQIQPARQRQAVRQLRGAAKEIDGAQDALGRAVSTG
jgi:hypothetical protein